MNVALAAAKLPAQRALWLTALAVALSALLFHGAWAAMARTWWHSETYAHGMLIVPIALWLLWRVRDALFAAPHARAPWALLAVAALAALWLAGDAGGVIVVQQLSAVLVVPTLVCLLLGVRVLRVVAFPLGFLLFAVPMGEFLVPPMMVLTADQTVFLLRATGIPVYREGLFFTLPSGSWSVVEACSGVRYLIASVALGALYAYLMYRSWHRRVAFMAAAVAVPVVANVLRAYFIVLLGHYSDMTLAVGVDHLLYGWLFFGIVIALLFALGARWREDGAQPTQPINPASPTRASVAFPAPLAVAAFAMLGAAVGYGTYLEARPLAPTPQLALPEAPSGWRSAAASDLEPHYRNARLTRSAAFAEAGAESGVVVNAFVAYYRDQRHGRELAAWDNGFFAPGASDWRVLRSEVRTLPGGQAVRQSELLGPQGRWLVWHWYWADGVHTLSRERLKAHEAWRTLRGARDDAAVVVLYAKLSDGMLGGSELAAQSLARLADAWWPLTQEALHAAAHD